MHTAGATATSRRKDFMTLRTNRADGLAGPKKEKKKNRGTWNGGEMERINFAWALTTTNLSEAESEEGERVER